MPRGDSGTSPGLVALTLSESPQSIGIPMSLEDYSFELNRPYLVQIQHYHGLHPLGGTPPAGSELSLNLYYTYLRVVGRPQVSLRYTKYGKDTKYYTLSTGNIQSYL